MTEDLIKACFAVFCVVFSAALAIVLAIYLVNKLM